jgi:hypothetical protein
VARAQAEPLRELGEALGAELFRKPSLVTTPDVLNFLLAMSCERLGAIGFYSLPSRSSRLYLALTRLAKPD